MNDNILSRERVYQPKEVSDFLSIGSSTLRKWCLLLEKEGYHFTRDDNERRVFSEHDVIALRNMKELTKDGLMSLENAAIAISQRSKASATHEGTQVVEAEESTLRPIERFNELIEMVNELVENGKRRDELIRKQEALIQALVIQSEKQESLIRELINERDDQHNSIMDELKGLKEQVAAVQEKKTFFGRLFGK